jgi:hypothetical protein
MMKKIWNSLILRSVLAVFTGLAIVVAFVNLLSVYGISQEATETTVTQQLVFPENEQMLDAMAATLSNIEPAAGDKQNAKR